MTIKKLFLTCILLTGVICAMSQGTPGGGTPGGGEPGGNLDPGTGTEPPPEGAVPVDGGLAFLLAGGVAYGAKKAYDYRKGQKSKGKS